MCEYKRAAYVQKGKGVGMEEVCLSCCVDSNVVNGNEHIMLLERKTIYKQE